MQRAYYSNSIPNFVREDPNAVLGLIAKRSSFAIEQSQRDAWIKQIEQLQNELQSIQGSIYLEYSIPRMGKRIDVLLLVGAAIYVIEYKVGEKNYSAHAIDQVTDYALDLKNFHETSHDRYIVPVLVATKAKSRSIELALTDHNDKLFEPVCCNGVGLAGIFESVHFFISMRSVESEINSNEWTEGRYQPTPTIVEAAIALYNGHAVAEISRSDATGEELKQTTDAIEQIVDEAKSRRVKAACFVTGVPGAGKTLIGLNVATKHLDNTNKTFSVFLSGNGPLVKILQEALARDRVERAKLRGEKIIKKKARSDVKAFVQNVHHYRDECLSNTAAPADHIAIFDEAQRAWNREQTSTFMRQKKGQHEFDMSEPEFLISCIDRHQDWGVVVCLVGGGQEINKGEAGIGAWIDALIKKFPDWHIHISDRLHDAEFGAGSVLESLQERDHVSYNSGLHLGVSMRSYRAENVSNLVKQLLDIDANGAKETLSQINENYPIVLTRDLNAAKEWLRRKARGSERYGIVVSSQANRLKPLAIDVRLKPDPVHWFLAGKDDVRSSYYLEDVCTEFDVQGLELDWVCVTWDADFRFNNGEWMHRKFKGNRWENINKDDRQAYLKNAYRVLLTRARQGMVIVVPEGDERDPTRKPEFYDPTFEYLKSLNFEVLE